MFAHSAARFEYRATPYLGRAVNTVYLVNLTAIIADFWSEHGSNKGAVI
jgi:hypothetical protein